MFIMTSDIRIGKFKNIKPNSVKWKCSVSNFKDECTILLPLKSYLKSNFPRTQTGELAVEVAKLVDKGLAVFSEGDLVEVYLGYNQKNTLRFKGFVKQLNYTTPLELVCEGYIYKLKDKMFTKSYQHTTVKQILSDLIKGTDIKISEYTQDAPLKNVTFKNAPAVKVLEWFQKECLMNVYFDFDKLYVGFSKFGLKKGRHKLRTGWNVVEDKELKKDDTETTIQINLVEKSSKGSVKRTRSEKNKYDNIKDIKVRTGMSDTNLKKIADELQKLENFKGYKGDVTCFLVPHFDKGFVAEIESKRFPDKNGDYFVECVDGSFDSSGGRQKLTLRYYGAN